MLSWSSQDGRIDVDDGGQQRDYTIGSPENIKYIYTRQCCLGTLCFLKPYRNPDALEFGKVL